MRTQPRGQGSSIRQHRHHVSGPHTHTHKQRTAHGRSSTHRRYETPWLRQPVPAHVPSRHTLGEGRGAVVPVSVSVASVGDIIKPTCCGKQAQPCVSVNVAYRRHRVQKNTFETKGYGTSKGKWCRKANPPKRKDESREGDSGTLSRDTCRQWCSVLFCCSVAFDCRSSAADAKCKLDCHTQRWQCLTRRVLCSASVCSDTGAQDRNRLALLVRAHPGHQQTDLVLLAVVARKALRVSGGSARGQPLPTNTAVHIRVLRCSLAQWVWFFVPNRMLWCLTTHRGVVQGEATEMRIGMGVVGERRRDEWRGGKYIRGVCSCRTSLLPASHTCQAAHTTALQYKRTSCRG